MKIKIYLYLNSKHHIVVYLKRMYAKNFIQVIKFVILWCKYLHKILRSIKSQKLHKKKHSHNLKKQAGNHSRNNFALLIKRNFNSYIKGRREIILSAFAGFLKFAKFHLGAHVLHNTNVYSHTRRRTGTHALRITTSIKVSIRFFVLNYTLNLLTIYL